MTDSERKVKRLVEDFGIVCWRKKLKVNIGKTKVVLKCSKAIGGERTDVQLK